MEQNTVTSLILKTPPTLTEHPAAVYLSGLSDVSRLTMRHCLDKIAQLLTDGKADCLTLDWAKLKYKHTAAVRTALMNHYSPATTNKMLCALRRTLKEALRLELMSAADYARAVDITSIKFKNSLRGRALSEDEIAALISTCANDFTPAGYRDAALIAILRGSGLRRTETVNLDLKDFDPNTGGLKVRDGKGRQDRTVYLPDGAIVVVADWLEVRGNAVGPLLNHVNKAGRVVLKRLTSQAVLHILQKRGEESGVENFSSHDFRRTFVSDLLDAGVDIVTVQKLAGHSSPTITSRYDRRKEEKKRKAVQSLNIPGWKR